LFSGRITVAWRKLATTVAKERELPSMLNSSVRVIQEVVISLTSESIPSKSAALYLIVDISYPEA
jgi:hypothetical protein